MIHRQLRSAFLIALCLVAMAVPAAMLPAQPGGGGGGTLAEEQGALARAKRQAEEARQRSELLEQRAANASAEADRARDRAAALAARIQQSEADMRAGQARIAIIGQMQRAQARRLAARQGPIVRLTAALQQIARRSPVMALVQPGSVADAVHRRIVLRQVLPVVLQRTRGLRAEIARSAELRESAEAAARAMVTTRDGLANQRGQLAALEQRKRVASRGLRESAGLEAERALAMGEKARDIGDLLTQLQDDAVVRDALLLLPGPTPRPASPGRTALPGNDGAMLRAVGEAPGYRLPVIGDVVTGFGELSPSGVRARGLTIATSPSATVVAPASGRISFAGPFRGYGHILILDHGGGWTSLITNLDQLSAVVGDTVRQGDPLGAAGPGKPRITIELRRQDRPIDIAALLR